MELLAVAGREEKRVVGAGTEDEHEENAAGLTVDDDAGVDEERPEAAHQASAKKTDSSGRIQKIGLR